MSVAPQKGQRGVEIVAVGDILLDRGIRRSIERFGFEYPFAKTSAVLNDADIAFANLENPLTGQCRAIEKKYVFRAEPETAEILKRAGFDVFSLANNHSADCGGIGLENTFRALAKRDIRYVGADLDDGSQSAVVVTVRGLKIGFVAYTAISPAKSGNRISGVSYAEPEKISREISGLRNKAEIVVASFHWGAEYALEPNLEQIRLARLAVESGADIVLGHHPHVLQGIHVIERATGKRKAVIAYSLGNFVFDSPIRLNRLLGESMILRINVNAEGVFGAEIVPVLIENHRPVIATGSAKDNIENRIERLSTNFGTVINERRIVITNDVFAKGSVRQ